MNPTSQITKSWRLDSIIHSIAILLTIGIALLFSGCATSIEIDTANAGAKERAESDPELEVVALFGIRTTWNGEAIDSKKLLGSKSGLRFPICSFDRPDGWERPKLKLLDGGDDPGLIWAYLTLPPGSYILLENPTNLVRKEYSYPFKPSGFRFQLGRKESVAYLGTLSYHFEGNRNVRPEDLRIAIRQGLMEPDSMRFSLEEDQSLAETIARERLGLEKGFAVNSFETLEEVRSRARASRPDLVISESGLSAVSQWNSSGDRGAAATLEAEPTSSPYEMGRGIAEWGVGYLIYPLADYVTSVQTDSVFFNPKKLVDFLDEELTEEDPTQGMVIGISRELGLEGNDSLEKALGGPAVISGEALPEEILVLGLQRISLRECAKRTLCFEFDFHARVLDARTMRYGYQERFVYTNPTALGPKKYDSQGDYFGGRPSYPSLYETRLPGPSRRIKASKFSLRKQETRELFQAELNEALVQAQKSVLNRFAKLHPSQGGSSGERNVALIHDSEPIKAEDGDDIWRLSVWGLNGDFNDYESPVEAPPGAVEIRYRLEKEDFPTQNLNLSGAAVRSAAIVADSVIVLGSAAATAVTGGGVWIPPIFTPIARSKLSGSKANNEYIIRHTVEKGKSYALKFEVGTETQSEMTVWLEEVEPIP